MEVGEETGETILAEELHPWRTDLFKQVKSDELLTSIFAVSHGVLQRNYHYNDGYLAELTIRRTIGIPLLGSKLDLMWLRGHDDSGSTVYIGIESEYVYERTGMLSSPSVAKESNNTTVPIFDVLVAVVFQLEPILGIQAETLLSEAEILEVLPEVPINNYLALDHKRRAKLIFYGEHNVLDSMEANARDYCVDYWQRRDQVAAFLKRPVVLGFFLSKRIWPTAEFNGIHQGDLLALQGLRTNPDTYRLRGYLSLLNNEATSYKYEVQFNMSESDVEIEFTGESINDPQQTAMHLDVPPHEQIELDIIAGRTTIPLGELCAVQTGTLIELGRHSLPMVTLCVNGEAVLEGELVHFKDQVMVQVTKRLV